MKQAKKNKVGKHRIILPVRRLMEWGICDNIEILKVKKSI